MESAPVTSSRAQSATLSSATGHLALPRQRRSSLQALGGILSALLALAPASADASIAYGSINNFDTVNDTGHECHGFEIDIEDCHSTDITYTYNYNHYGVPNITEDNSVAGHPKTIIRWESKKNPDGTWAAYTAIPAGPIPPTQGHQFTNPTVNFGGEHFGAGYNKAVGAVSYNWLIDNGAGTLVNGGAVQVSTPTFTYCPPAAGVAQVQAVMVIPSHTPVIWRQADPKSSRTRSTIAVLPRYPLGVRLGPHGKTRRLHRMGKGPHHRR